MKMESTIRGDLSWKELISVDAEEEAILVVRYMYHYSTGKDDL
jgi:hypothetical protein